MREKLLRLKAELEADAERAGDAGAIVELDQSKVGRLSRMDAMQAQAMARASEQRRQVMLRGITAALKRMDDGDYGICLECDEPINPKRLDEFRGKNDDRLALDSAGNLAYLAPTRVNLQLIAERWPDIEFRATREH